MNKVTYKTGFIILISIAFPYLFSGILHLEPLIEGTTIYMAIWMMSNYLFLTTMEDLFPKYRKILSLKGLKISKLPYILKFLVYIVFLAFINLYMIQILFIRDNDFINSLVSIPSLVLILFIFFLNLSYGAFPELKEEDNFNLYSVSNKNSFKLGRDKFGTVVGSYEDGIIIGDIYLSYNQISSIYSNKKDKSLMIKADEDKKNIIVSIESDKSKQKMIEIIKNAQKNNRIEKKLVNI